MQDDDERRLLLSPSTMFTIEPEQLMGLVDPKNPSLLKQLGGIQYIASALNVDLSSGIFSDTVSVRQQVFGCNELPQVQSKSLWKLIVTAYNDKTISKQQAEHFFFGFVLKKST